MEQRSEVVVSGISGRYPGAGNTEELWKYLVQGQNVISCDTEAKLDVLNLPRYKGSLPGQKSFDHTMFGIHTRLAEKMDINTCVILETAFGAICDSGVNPYDLTGKEILVVVGSGPSKYDLIYSVEKANNGFSIVGGSQCMMANRLSHALNLKGPSYNIDGSWNGMLEGLKYAQSLVSSGMAEAAIIGGTNVERLDECSFHYKQMGRLNEDGKTKCFSDNADGYTRSEACVVLFVQRKQDAQRIYGTVIDTIIGDCFNKNVPPADVDAENASKIMKKAYEKYPNLIKELVYIECSGEALKYWDKVELNSIANVLLKEREKPLLIGSIKSNVGHCEDAAAGVALAKALYSFDRGIIPPNLHYSTSNNDVPALKSGALKVITEPTKLEGNYIGVNTYSADGSLSHVIIKRNPKTKKKEPKVGVLPDGLPRLFVASARHEQGIKHILKTVQEMPIDEEFIALGHKLYRNIIRPYPFRGYTILNDKGEVFNGMKEYNMHKRPIWYVFSGMGSQWTGMGTKLMEIPIFANAIHKCHEILKPLGINLIDVITTTDKSIYDNILNSFVGIAAVQIGLVDILNAIGLVPDGILGHSVGELGCAYADGCFTAEQMILAAYARGKASLDADLIPGMMAAVGMGYSDIKDELPEGIDVACRNSATSCTLSGPTLLMEEYVASIKEKGIFAKLVNASNIAYHSRYIQPAAPALLESLKKVIPEPKKRTSKWISSSVQKNDWDKETAMYSSAEYHTNNLLGSVLFEEASEYVPKDAIVVEIAPHGLLQAIIKKSMPSAIHIPLTHRAQPDGVIYLLTALGKLYLEGVALEIDKLYPPVEFPVSRGTPSFEPFLFWNHGLAVSNTLAPSKDYSKNVNIEFTDEKYLYLKECTVNGQHYIPPSIYLDLIMDHYQSLNGTKEPIVIEDFKVKCNPKITDGVCQLYLCLQTGCGDWELCQDFEEVSHGRNMHCIKSMPVNKQFYVDGIVVSKDEIYSYLSSKGVEIGTSCQLIQSLIVSDEGSTAKILWNGKWTTFMDNILLLCSLLEADDNTKLKLLYSIQRITIDYENLNFELEKEISVSFEKHSGLICCEGMEILCPQIKRANVPKRLSKEVVCNKLKFIPYLLPKTSETDSIFDYSLKIIVQNMKKAVSVPKIYIIEVDAGVDLHQQILQAVKKTNGVKVEILKVGGSENIQDFGSEDGYFSILIVTASKELNNSVKILKQVEHGYLLLLNQTPPPSLVTILEQKNSSDSFFLCKMNSHSTATPNFVLLSDPCWRRTLETKLSQDNNIVYLVGTSVSLPGIHKLVQECERMYDSNRIRFVYFDKETFDLSKHENQLAKDLKINIHHNGQWCTYGLSSSIINTDHQRTDSDIFSLSNLRCPGINLSTLGINLADVSGVDKKIGVIEYVGEKNGKKVCGLATFSDKTKTLQPDSQLLWPKPKNWSDSDIASVLLAYSMAYYILKVDNDLNNKRTIYVSHAVHPLSQAIITIALNCKMEVFTTYSDSKEKNWIKQTFPEIPEENLVDINNKQIDVMMKIKLGGKGLSIIVNTLPDPCMVEKSVGLLGFGGKCYQVSLAPSKADEKIGMFIFLRQTAVVGLSLESLLQINDDEKEKLRQAVAQGLQLGEVKSLPYEQLANKHLNIDAISLLRNKKSLPTKLIVDMENKLPPNTSSSYFTASPDNSYLIIGDTMNLWINVCEWLIKRGAQNIYLVLRKHSFTSSSNQQFNRLMHSNPLLNLNLLSLQRIKDKESIDGILKEINNSYRLSCVFVIGEENEVIVKNLCASKEKFLLVSLNSGGEAECETRSASGLPSLAISTIDNSFKSDLIISTLDHLIAQRNPVVYMSELKGTQIQVHDLTMAEYFQSLPNSSADLLQLINNSKRASWKEVRTSGFKSVNSREVNPVFVLSTLRKSHLGKFIPTLYYPAFEAIIPSHCNNITDIANQLTQEILKFKNNEITLICSDWAWSLGFTIAQLLEEEDKSVCLIALDSSAKRTSKSLIQNYISHMKFKLLRNEDENISKGLQVLENRLDLLHLPIANGPNKYKGFLHIVVPDSEEHFDINTIQEYCERPIRIHVIPSSNFSSLLSEKRTVRVINSLALFEHKTAGRKVKKQQYFECGIIEHALKTKRGLQRIQ
ncbi:fatty acid synthase [Halyomorpha halys]|uniref:fatty acid synthase n=1 Tax=Halyomorpha halys TaxID=286706 RepID=UPI0006D4ED8D|nr:fatty acid synthase [Halyomorpha halys]XP_014286165.1 fatty acid synthase [Halyomorpha halys]